MKNLLSQWLTGYLASFALKKQWSDSWIMSLYKLCLLQNILLNITYNQEPCKTTPRWIIKKNNDPPRRMKELSALSFSCTLLLLFN